MNVFLATFGTEGDIFPHIGLGQELAARGHDVVLVTSESYQRLARQHGLGFEALVSREKTEALLNNPSFWNPRKGGFLTAKWSRRLLARQFDLLSDITSHRDAILVSSPGVLATRIVHDKHRVPMATLLLQAALIPSRDAPPALPVGPRLPRATPNVIADLYWRMIDATILYLVGPELNRVRKRVGLEPVTSLLDWYLSPELVLGMFPAWYAPPQSDWPSQIRLLGFPLYDGSSDVELSEQYEQLKTFLDRGEPPVVFTAGTQMRHSASFFETAIKVCDALSLRGILITKHAHQLPPEMPDWMLHTEYASFQKLFPRCAAVVHHGGIGTAAQALAAGVPQLVRYMTFDQRDNGMRLRRLRVGKPIRSSRCTYERMIEALRALLQPKVLAQCVRIAARFADLQERPLQQAAVLLERLQRKELADCNQSGGRAERRIEKQD